MPSVAQFIAARRERWQELETLLKRSDGNGLRSLRSDDLDRLGAGYRHVVSDLAIAQRDYPREEVTRALNDLATRAHMRLYRAPSGSWRRIGAFFTIDFARRFRDAWPYVAVAGAMLLLPAIWGYLAALLDPTLRPLLVSADLRSIMERGRTWTDMEAQIRPAMSALIFVNNIRVSFLAFAGGILFGVGSALLLAYNGLNIGAVLGAGQYYGVGHLLVDFVSAHGWIELFSISIAGGAGLMMGHALLRPGRLRRRDAVTRAGRRAVELVLGAAPVFVLAGLVEGFISSSGLPFLAKVLIGPLLLAILLALLLTLGRSGEPRSARAA